MKNIIIQGAGFADNFGDVLFYDIFSREALNRNVNVNLFGVNPKVLRHLKVSESNNKKNLKSILNSDGIVFIGGGYMGEQPYNSIIKLYRWGFSTVKNILYLGILGIIFKKKIIVIGVGAGNITNIITRKIIKLICNHSEKTIVRDIESYEALIRNGVKAEQLEVTTDTALALSKYYSIDNNYERIKSITLHISESYEICENTRILIEDIDRFLDEFPEYKLNAITDHNGGGQDRAIESLKKRFGEKVSIYRYESPEQLINKLNTFDIVITNKLHIGIVSSALGKNVISLANHPKVKRFFKQIGYQERCIDFKDINSGVVYNLLIKCRNKDIKIQNHIVNKAYENINYFRDFIK